MFYSVVIYPLTQLIELVFSFCKKLFDSTPVALIGVSLAVSLFTLPLYIVAEHWQQVERDKQKKMKPTVDKIKSVFKGNEQYMILSTYYRQQHYHPIMGLRSAFGLLIQIPFFTAAYTCLSNMSALHGSSFWIFRDLGSPDAVFMIGSFKVNILPILMTLINMGSGLIYTKGLGIRDKVQVFGLALVFVAILYNSPAGLVMYWTMNNLFSLIKNVFYKMKNPIKVLYYIACAAVTALIIWLFACHVLSVKRALLVSVVFAMVYFAPLFVKLCNWLIDNPLSYLKDNRKIRTSLFILSCLSLALLLGRLIPTLLISSSPMEFSGIDGYGNPMFFVNNTFIQAIGLCIVWPCLVYFLFKERIQTLASFGFFSLLLMSLLNTFVFQGNYGNLSKLLIFTDAINVDSPIKLQIINILSIIAIFALIIVLIKKFNASKLLSYIAGMCAFSLFGVSFMNSQKINKGYNDYKRLKAQGGATEKTIPKIFHLSRNGKNVIYLYMDRAQNMMIEPLFKECPELVKSFDGFTLYKNTVSFNGHTLIGAAPCYGGYEYTPEAMNRRKETTLIEKQNQALLLLPRIFTEQAENFSATVTDPTWANYNWIPDISIFNKYEKINAHITDNKYLDRWYKDHNETAKLAVTSKSLKRNILWYGLFRMSPLSLRPAFYNDGNYWSTNKENDDFNDYLAGYSVLDYLPEFTDFDSKTENVYMNLTNNTTHDGIFLQAPEYTIVPNVTNYGTSEHAKDRSYHSFAGAFKRLGEWMDLLQKENIYNNCRIVIVADHGAGGSNNDYENTDKLNKIGTEHYHPLLMVKDFGETGELKIDTENFMTNADTPLLLTEGIIQDAKNPFTGKKLEPDKENGVLVCTSDIWMPHHNKSKYVFTAKKNEWWRVKQNIFKDANWTQEDH
ncbi:MAG: YidC/Oxa1 family membrane protein insertase [Treponema sp.]|nr:YidC/Oxa1 family membrane protein insertase [Treponema sp.]